MADTNYFRKTASDLFPGKTYYFQFRWKYADGTYSAWSATKAATASGTLQVESPTLATGLTAATASFGITVDWDGTYSSSTFLGFKAINIYASTSNLGSSTTTDLTANLVGSMTVDQVKNRITIGSTLLKNVLSLNSATVYTTQIFLYYITINETNEVYKSGGVATYTRINSTGINPTQANFIDLASGVISIENLVAGNGQFTEYLRAGTRAGDGSGARIEISGSSSNITSTNGGTVLPGLTIYDSSGAESLRAPLSGGLTVTGIIKQGSSGNYILMDQTYKASIQFFNTGFSQPGFITTEALYNGTLGELTISPPSNGTDNSIATINMFSSSSGGSSIGAIYLSADTIDIDADSLFSLSGPADGIQILTAITANNFTFSTTNDASKSVRNIIVSPASLRPTGPQSNEGERGDVWFGY
jgi:hypothetical protein